jgi:hypothetical protein
MNSGMRRRIVVLLVASLLNWGVVTRVSAKPNDGRQPVVITFTKWITTFPAMEGVAGGDVVGDFDGEVLRLQNTTNPLITSITWLVAICEIQAGSHSFTALVQGGQDTHTNKALLDGTILGGWHSGARVHVEFLQINDSTVCTSAGAPPGTSPCFQGTISIGPDFQ